MFKTRNVHVYPHKAGEDIHTKLGRIASTKIPHYYRHIFQTKHTKSKISSISLTSVLACIDHIAANEWSNNHCNERDVILENV
jgi:hypothetical protein